ncbi:MAG: hypothetical protein FWF81_12920 [Defluviitaleaceae bacterium]|nr:hypothetical protein [Defluviitaleaceae bacterium]
MLKAEFIQALKQVNVSENAEKTKERLRAIWSPLPKPKREEILELADLTKFAIERAYKTGKASTKIIVAVSQVVGVDPYYLAGKSDEQRPFDDALLVQFLTDLKYNVGNSGTTKRRNSAPKGRIKTAPTPTKAPMQKSATDTQGAIPSPATSPITLDLSAIANEFSKLDKKSLEKINELTEDSLILMLKCITVQAEFSESKKNRLALIKYLLLA